MSGIGTFFAVVLFGFIGLMLGSLVDAAEAGAVVFAVAIAAACIVDAVQKSNRSKESEKAPLE